MDLIIAMAIPVGKNRKRDRIKNKKKKSHEKQTLPIYDAFKNQNLNIIQVVHHH